MTDRITDKIMDRLETIQFETTTACNAECTMCALPTMIRKGGRMAEQLFHKIVREGYEMGVRHFIPFLNGEPLIDTRFFAWMDHMAGYSGLTTTIFTNVSLLDEEKARRLAGYGNIREVVLSFHGGTKESYEKVMVGLGYEDSKAKAEYFISVAPYPVKVYMTEFEDNAGTKRDFRETWGKRAFVGAYFNWAGKRPSGMVQDFHPPRPCARVLSQMTIMWDGRVNLCCMDIDGEVILGDANTQHLRDIWLSNWEMRARHKAYDFDMPLCRDCNQNRYGV